MRSHPTLAVIGGSGLYEMSSLEDAQEFDIDTPFGKPSAPVMVGTIAGKRVAFLARHGIGHTISPSEINFRANIYLISPDNVKEVSSERVWLLISASRIRSVQIFQIYYSIRCLIPKRSSTTAAHLLPLRDRASRPDQSQTFFVPGACR